MAAVAAMLTTSQTNAPDQISSEGRLVTRFKGPNEKAQAGDLKRDTGDDLSHRKFRYFDTLVGYSPLIRDNISSNNNAETIGVEAFRNLMAGQYILYWHVDSSQFYFEQMSQHEYNNLVHER